MVALVGVAGQELRALGVGARDDERRHAAGVGGKARGIEAANVLGGGNEHLAAQMPAFLFRGELVLEMHGRRARLDIGLHDLEGVERAAEACFRVGHDGREPMGLAVVALGPFDLIGALQSAVDAPAELGAGIGGIETLVGIHGARGVRVGGDLPAREVNGLEPGAHHLHRLVAGHGAQRRHIGLAFQELPQPVRAHLGQRVIDADRAPELHRLLGRVAPLDALEPPPGRVRHQGFEAGLTHGSSPRCSKMGQRARSTMCS